MIRRCALLVLCLAVVGGACSSGSHAESEALPVIIDTDVSIDDTMAILYLLQRPDVDVRAVAVSGTGVARCTGGVAVVLGLLEAAEASDIPVACGREAPLEGSNAFPEEWRDGVDRLAASGVLPSVAPSPETTSAAELIAVAADESPTPPMVVELGPHTNLAEALREYPDLESRLAGVHMMGGALDVGGNTFANPRAEWNLWIDPAADATVFATDLPLSIVPLDATAQVPVTTWFADLLAENLTTPEAEAAHAALTFDPLTVSAGNSFWDQLAVVALVEPGVVQWQELDVTVLQQGGPELAGTLAAGIGRPARVAVAADRRAFESEYLSTLADRPVAASEWETEATIVVTGDGWEYDGPERAGLGPLTILVRNESEHGIVTVVGWLIGDATEADLDAWTSIQQPPFLEVGDFAFADPRVETVWTVRLEHEGTNYLIGLDLVTERPAWRHPIEVSDND